MKNLIVIGSILLLTISISNAQETAMFNLTIEISGFTSNKGKVLIGLYNDEESFLKKIYKSGTSKIKDNKTIYTIEGLSKAEYAVSIVHDENDNNKMDTNFFGIPKENYGCSNNAKGFMGPPKYKDAKFTLHKGMTIKIRI